MPDCGCSSTRGANGSGGDTGEPFAWFDRMIPNCLDYARAQHAQGRPIVGIMCEFTPRELIMAGGGVPVCLCGGSAAPIATAEEELPPGLCPIIKSTYGYHLERANPFLELADLVISETTCDGKKKMFELMAAGRAMHVLELPQKPDDPDARAHWRRELEKLRTALETRWGVLISDCRLRQAIAQMNRERRLRRALAELMAADAPTLDGRRLLALRSIIAAIPADLAQYEAAHAQLLAAPPDPDARRRPRVLLTGVPIPHGAERVVELIEERGGLIVAMENCTGLKPIVDDVDEQATDPLGALADYYFALPCSVMTPNQRRLELIERLARRYRAQCVIELVWQGCLTYDVEAARVRRLVEEQLGLPYLKLQTDYSPADSARIAVRVEALLETVGAAAMEPAT